MWLWEGGGGAQRLGARGITLSLGPKSGGVRIFSFNLPRVEALGSVAGRSKRSGGEVSAVRASSFVCHTNGPSRVGHWVQSQVARLAFSDGTERGACKCTLLFELRELCPVLDQGTVRQGTAPATTSGGSAP